MTSRPAAPLLLATTAVAIATASSDALGQTPGAYSVGPGEPAPTAPGDQTSAAPGDARAAESPGFTQDRDFTESRFWRLDTGKYTVEQWWRGELGSGPNTADHLFRTEIEMGVAPHLQVDIYANAQATEDAAGVFQVGTHTGVSAELRYAIPRRYGEIWGNPTLYFELASQYYGSPRAEGRVLLGGEIFAPRLLGVVNLHYERNILDDPTAGFDQEIGADLGFSYAIVPSVLRAGVESKVGWDNGGGPTLNRVLWLGPSVLVSHPSKRIKLLATLFRGLQPADPRFIPVVIVGSTF